MEPTVVQLAEQMQAALERKTRDNGSEFVALRDGSPEWMQEVCRTAHEDMLPDDARYFMIERAVDALADLDDDADEDAENEAGDMIPSAGEASYSDIVAWLGSYAGFRFGYADQAVEEYGADDLDTFKRLALGMDYEQREVFASVLNSLRDARYCRLS